MIINPNLRPSLRLISPMIMNAIPLHFTATNIATIKITLAGVPLAPLTTESIVIIISSSLRTILAVTIVETVRLIILSAVVTMAATDSPKGTAIIWALATTARAARPHIATAARITPARPMAPAAPATMAIIGRAVPQRGNPKRQTT
jgi:hypothetical protein